VRGNGLVLGLVALAIGLACGCGSSLAGSDGGGGHAGSGAGGSGGGAGGPGNPGTDSGVLSCGMSVAQACASLTPETCDLTWSAVQTDTSLCTLNTVQSRHLVYDCVGYHVLGSYAIDSGIELYYDSTTGDLVAILSVGAGSATGCLGGPSGGFTHPSGCDNGSSLPPPQCVVDGGNADRPAD
jgi:hypothetical protein